MIHFSIGKVNLAGVAVFVKGLSISNYEGLAALDLGGKHMLIQNTTGTFTSQNLTDVISGTETHGFVANADTSLYVFKNNMTVTGDYSLAGPVVYTADSENNESILLDVSGALTVTVTSINIDNGYTFTATSVNNGAAVVDTLNVNSNGGTLTMPAALAFTNVYLAAGSNFTALTSWLFPI